MKGKDCRLTKKSYLEDFPLYIKIFSDNKATNMDKLQQIRYKKKRDDRPKFTSKLLQLALMLRYSLLPAYLCEYINCKSDRHERVAAENVMKFNDLPQSFPCDNHLEKKFINRKFCYVYFNNAQKFVNSLVRREVLPARWCSGESVRIAVGRPGVDSLSRVISKDFKKFYSQLPYLALS